MKKPNKKQQIGVKKRETTRSKQRAFMVAYIAHTFNVSAACRETKISRDVFYRWQRDPKFQQALDHAVEERLDIIEAALFERINAGDTTAIIFSAKTLCKNRGYVEGERVKSNDILDKRALAILDDLISQRIDAIEAGLQFTKVGLPLPEIVRLMISKIQGEAPVPDLPAQIPDEELEARYQAQIEKNEKELKEFVPARQEEVRQLKEELKGADSYGPDAENRTARGDGKK